MQITETSPGHLNITCANGHKITHTTEYGMFCGHPDCAHIEIKSKQLFDNFQNTFQNIDFNTDPKDEMAALLKMFQQ